MAKILLVDDSAMLLRQIQRMLLSGGHTVVTASSGREAVELLGSGVDLVLTDLYMPPPDGFEIVDAARKLPRPPVLVVMSSNSKACRIFRDARMLGAAAVLTKPFTAPQLLDTLNEVLVGKVAAPGEAMPLDAVSAGAAGK